VRNLEALDATPIVDVKPLLTPGELEWVEGQTLS
jgi:tRNA (Thr-GGU) A37 N-methylase